MTHEHSEHQNIVLIDIDQGAEVEVHEVANSESLYILKGEYEVIFSDRVELLNPGDLVYFAP